ncbi:MAG: POTRA domain-containing protein, partial [Candidatus Zixiibacteriota bacterium]
MRRLELFVAACIIFTSLKSTAAGMDRSTLRWIRSKPPIDSIAISGNKFFSNSKIKKQMYSRERTLWSAIKGDRRTRLQRESQGRDTLEIKFLYLSNGFLGVQVLEKFEAVGKDSAALIKVIIDEGRQSFYGDKHIVGSFDRKFHHQFQKITDRLKEQQPINLFDLHQVSFDMKTILANQGYPYATVTFSVDTNSTDTLSPITFHIEADSLVHFGDITIEGLQKYPEYTARRELKVRKGEIYRRDAIIDSQRRLFESGYFSTIRLTQAEQATDRLNPDFILIVRERKPIYITVKTGAGQSKVRDLTWDFSAGFGKRNFLGSRRYDLLTQLSFSLGKESRLLNHNYQLRFTEPWFLGVRMPLT